MTSDRKNHTATILADGRVLITGGTSGVSATPVSSAEIFDPQTGSFTATASMTTGRVYHTATLLANGKVLITGGYNGTAYVATAELFDPAAGTNGNFNSTGSMSTSTPTMCPGSSTINRWLTGSQVPPLTYPVFIPKDDRARSRRAAPGNLPLRSTPDPNRFWISIRVSQSSVWSA